MQKTEIHMHHIDMHRFNHETNSRGSHESHAQESTLEHSKFHKRLRSQPRRPQPVLPWFCRGRTSRSRRPQGQQPFRIFLDALFWYKISVLQFARILALGHN
jgi:hypothetical protein